MSRVSTDLIEHMQHQAKALSLISGGLDSLLATRVVQNQGVHVEGINFFYRLLRRGPYATRYVRKIRPNRSATMPCGFAEQLGIKLHIVDIVDDYKQVVFNPQYGYGANLNPCLDCKIFMLHKAKEWIEDKGFDFVITGEVVGQRPKSQRKDTMPLVQQDSGIGDRLLRPLCAHRLPPTLPEREGWVDRERLYGFSRPQPQTADGAGCRARIRGLRAAGPVVAVS